MSRLAVAAWMAVASMVSGALAVSGLLSMQWWTPLAAGVQVLLAGGVLWLTRR